MKKIDSAVCCVCGEKIMSEEDLTVCENCDSLYHKMCWQDVNNQCIYCNKIKKRSEPWIKY